MDPNRNDKIQVFSEKAMFIKPVVSIGNTICVRFCRHDPVPHDVSERESLGRAVWLDIWVSCDMTRWAESCGLSSHASP